MKYSLIIFDWDGTLMDSTAKIVAAMQQAAAHCELPVPSALAVQQIIGISLAPAIDMLFKLNNDAMVERMVMAYKAAYLQLDQQACPLFDGTHDVLSQLKGRNQMLAVATGKARKGLDRVMQQSDTNHFFDDTICADEAMSKPSPDMLERLCQRLNVPTREAVMIGDTVHDMKMAQALAMDRIGVSFGAHSTEQLLQHEPKTIVAHPHQLLDWL